jgi:ribosomal protein S18 acetylase RimI-like enzyme
MAVEKILIREALPGDAGAVALVQIKTWQHAYVSIFPKDKLTSLDRELVSREVRWEANISNQDSYPVFFVAENAEGEVIGFAGAGEQVKEEYPHDAELYLIYVLPGYQRAGIGRRLFNAAAEKLILLGFTSLILWVLEQNEPSRNFYRKLGGKEVGELDYLRWDKTYQLVAYGWDDLDSIASDH